MARPDEARRAELVPLTALIVTATMRAAKPATMAVTATATQAAMEAATTAAMEAATGLSGRRQLHLLLQRLRRLQRFQRQRHLSRWCPSHPYLLPLIRSLLVAMFKSSHNRSLHRQLEGNDDQYLSSPRQLRIWSLFSFAVVTGAIFGLLSRGLCGSLFGYELLGLFVGQQRIGLFVPCLVIQFGQLSNVCLWTRLSRGLEANRLASGHWRMIDRYMNCSPHQSQIAKKWMRSGLDEVGNGIPFLKGGQNIRACVRDRPPFSRTFWWWVRLG